MIIINKTPQKVPVYRNKLLNHPSDRTAKKLYSEPQCHEEHGQGPSQF